MTPGALSVPEAVSTAHGPAAAIASATLSGPSPPERISGTFERRAASSFQSQVRPVPPRMPSAAVSSMWKSVRQRSRSRMSPSVATRAALMILQPVRRAASVQNEGPSSPCSCRCEKPILSASSASSSSVALTNTPTHATRRRSSLTIAAAVSASQARGEPSQRIRPIAQAPSPAASSASSWRVMPQIFARVTRTS